MVPASLNERLGYAPDARLLIVNCDDLGSSRAANVAIYEALARRRRHERDADGPVPVGATPPRCTAAKTSACTSRSTPSGATTAGARSRTRRACSTATAGSRTVDDVWDHADLDEVRKECRAQVERAIYWGFDVTHLDSHMGTLQLRPAFFDAYLETAVDFGLPLRMAPAPPSA